MSNPFFQFKQFTVHHDRCAMKVTTDSCFFGAWTANEIKNSEPKIKSMLDIGSGTGLLSLMIAQKNEIEIDAVEIDREACEQAAENIQGSPWKDRIAVYHENILSFHPSKKYDCIISNPPFYENELAAESQTRNIAHHSSQLNIQQVLDFIKMHLREDGIFFLLLPAKRFLQIEQLIRQKELPAVKLVTLKQSVKHAPFRMIVKGSRSKPGLKDSSTISIWNENQQYTPEFVELLKDYYLYL